MAILPRLRLRRSFPSLLAALFGVAFLGIQAALIGTAGVRADHTYGFWMFHESSTVELRLYRVVAAEHESERFDRVETKGAAGEWEARDSAGLMQPRSWRERVKQPELSTFGRRIPAAYGSSAVLARLSGALEDVSQRTEDSETCRFEIDAAVHRNGRDEGTVRLRGPWRCTGKAEP